MNNNKLDKLRKEINTLKWNCSIINDENRKSINRTTFEPAILSLIEKTINILELVVDELDEFDNYGYL